MSGFEAVKQNLKADAWEQGGIFYHLPKLSDFEKKEIEFHDLIHQDEEDIHQLTAVRNKYYHDWFKKYLLNLPKDSTVLEIGSGSGYDAAYLVKSGLNLIISDISPQSVKGIQKKLGAKGNLIYLVADGQHLPFANGSIDAIFLVASLHHFESEARILAELRRVVKKGGLVVFAMEPSWFMMSFTKFFSASKSLRIHKGHSAADETHPGYILADWKRISSGLKVLKIKRVWLTLGFLHYGLEGIYRLLKLKKRLRVFRIFEWILLILDEILLKIPIVRAVNWHWIVILKRKD